MKATFGPGSPPLRGRLRVPGDKSLSHRAVLFGALADGTSHLRGVLDAEDVRSTIAAVRHLGALVGLDPAADGTLSGTVTGWGPAGPRPADGAIDCGNSGTTARLLLGALAGWPVTVQLEGDASLSRRPMRRVTEPLTRMGARFDTSADGTLPVTIHGAGALTPIDYDSPVASAQVKTALLLAGTRARGRTTVSEPAASRDHTERLLPAFGVPVDVDTQSHSVSVEGPATLAATDVQVPGDPSSAAFVVAAACVVPGSDVTVESVSLNPTRTGFLRVLRRMGAFVETTSATAPVGEPVGDIHVTFSPELTATTVEADEVPSLIDELPILALVAACASGTTRFEGVAELRVKESDRLAAVLTGLAALGADARATDDTLEVTGPAPLGAAALDARGDHRLAMTWAVAGLLSAEPVDVTGFEATAVSYPVFRDDIRSLQGLPDRDSAP